MEVFSAFEHYWSKRDSGVILLSETG